MGGSGNALRRLWRASIVMIMVIWICLSDMEPHTSELVRLLFGPTMGVEPGTSALWIAYATIVPTLSGFLNFVWG